MNISIYSDILKSHLESFWWAIKSYILLNFTIVTTVMLYSLLVISKPQTWRIFTKIWLEKACKKYCNLILNISDNFDNKIKKKLKNALNKNLPRPCFFHLEHKTQEEEQKNRIYLIKFLKRKKKWWVISRLWKKQKYWWS